MTALKFYCPNYIEFLFDFFGDHNIKTDNRYNHVEKEKVLNDIFELLNDKIIYVSKIQNKDFDRLNFSNDEIINKIDSLWSEKTKFQEFYDMILFGYEKWYINKLKDLGIEDSIDWERFVNDKIGDLEKWIKKNKPD